MEINSKYFSSPTIKRLLFYSLLFSICMLAGKISWAGTKDKINAVGGTTAVISSCVGGFGIPLQVSIAIHLGVFNWIAAGQDPYDPNYHEIYIPKLHNFPDYSPDGVLTPGMLGFLNDAIDKDALSIDYMRAFIVTRDRWESARIDGDLAAENLQWGALNDYYTTYSKYSFEAAASTRKLYDLLIHSSIPNPYVSDQDVVAFASSVIATRTFPASEETLFLTMDFTSDERDMLINVLGDLLNSGKLRGGYLFESVNNISIAQEENGKFVPDPIPEPSTLLLIGSGLAGIIGFRRKRLFKKCNTMSLT